VSARRLARLAPAILALGLVASPAIASAGSPAPSLLPPSVQAWLDAAYQVPGDLPQGGTVEVGLTFWDTQAHTFRDVEGVYARLHPAKGHADPTHADGIVDWRGHVLIDVPAPKGGPGDVEFFVHGAHGDQPLAIAGIGPPPDAPVADLVGAELLPVVGDVVAGRPFPLAVNVLAHGLWDVDTLHLPDRLIVSAAHPGGAELSQGELEPGGAPGSPYTGHLTIPETGEVELTMLVPANGGVDQPIAGSTASVTVIEGGRLDDVSSARPVPAAPADGTGADDTPAFLWPALVGLLVLAAVLVVGGPARRRLRGGR